METCTNCGAAVRPGAKFCTSCGTRLNTAQEAPAPAPDPASWNASTSEPADQTTDTETPDASSAFATWGRASSGWNTATNGSESAGRAETEADESTTTYRPVSWGSPSTETGQDSSEDRFASWAAAYGTSPEPAATPATEPPDTDTDQVSEADNDSTSLVPVADSGNALERTETSTGGEEARTRATELVDELRTLIWKIGLDEKAGDQDANLAVIVLAGARGQISDFSDITAALDALKKDPRDIDALRGLGAQADRIEELIASHKRLLNAIDEAIREMR